MICPEDKIRLVLRDTAAKLFAAVQTLSKADLVLSPPKRAQALDTVMKAALKLNNLQCLWVDEPDVAGENEDEGLPPDWEFTTLFQLPPALLQRLPTWHPYHNMRPYPKLTAEVTDESDATSMEVDGL